MNKKLPAWIVLTVISLVAALALAFTYNGTKERIAQTEENKTVAVRQALLPAAQGFEQVEDSEVYRGVNADGDAVGYIATGTVQGFGGEVEITVAVDPEGVIAGVSVGGANFNETPGLGAKAKEDKFSGQFAGKTAPLALTKNGGEIDAITAATITSSAVVRGVNDVMNTLSEKAGFTIAQAAAAVEEKGNGRYSTAKQGFGGPVYVELALDDSNQITEIIIGDDSFSETSGYGAKAREEAFYGQYIGKTGQLTLGEDIDAISGATITSTAVNDAVNLILLYVTDPAAYEALQNAEPVDVSIPEGAQAYTAQGKGLTGEFAVSISVDEAGLISGIEVGNTASDMDAAFLGRVQNDTTFLSQFIGQAAPFADVDVVAGATVSSNGVVAAVNAAYNEAMGIAEPETEAEPTEAPAQPVEDSSALTAQGKGLTGEFTVSVTLDENNAIAAVTVGDTESTMDASFLGMVKENEAFLGQFVGKTAPVDENTIDVVAGATVSSKGVVAAINEACANVPAVAEPAEDSSALTAQGKGLTGEFTVTVTLDESNAIATVTVGDTESTMDASFLGMVKENEAFLGQFVGKTAPIDEASIDVVAGATVSSKGVVAAINEAYANVPAAIIGGADGATSIVVSDNNALTAQGKGLTGEFTVTVTLDESNAIATVTVGDTESAMDASFLGMVKENEAFLGQFVGKTAPIDEASIDVVAGATVSSKGVVAAINEACANVPAAIIGGADGATSIVVSDNNALIAQGKGLTGEFTVTVTLDENNAIATVTVGDTESAMDASFLGMVKENEAFLSQFIGKTAPIDEASIDVVAGATVSSKGVVAAINEAVKGE